MGDVDGTHGGPLEPGPGSRTAPHGADASVDWARLADLDEAVGREVLEEIVAVGLDEVPAMLASLRDADDDGIAARAHALKSVVGNLGMTGAFERCQAIEAAARGGDAASARAMLPALEAESRRGLDALRAAYGPAGAGP